MLPISFLVEQYDTYDTSVFFLMNRLDSRYYLAANPKIIFPTRTQTAAQCQRLTNNARLWRRGRLQGKVSSS